MYYVTRGKRKTSVKCPEHPPTTETPKGQHNFPLLYTVDTLPVIAGFITHPETPLRVVTRPHSRPVTHPIQGSCQCAAERQLQGPCQVVWRAAARPNATRARAAVRSPPLRCWQVAPPTPHICNYKLTMPPESTCSGHHCGRQWSGTKRQRMHELPSIQRGWAARLGLFLLGYPGLTQIWRPRMRRGFSSTRGKWQLFHHKTLPPFMSSPSSPLSLNKPISSQPFLLPWSFDFLLHSCLCRISRLLSVR